MIREIIKSSVKTAVGKLWPGFFLGEIKIERPDNPVLGDYAVNAAFTLAKQLKLPSAEIASVLAEELGKNKPAGIDEIKSTSGYVNFFLSPEFLQKELKRIVDDKNYGQLAIGQNQSIIIEYSQPNIAKKMHVGHLRNTILGDALANIYQFLGYSVIRWNYLGDWGTQFGKLIAAYKLWGDRAGVEKDPINNLLALYIKFHEEAKTNPELEVSGQMEFKKLEDGDMENTKLWQWFKEESLKEFNKLYNRLGVKFDTDIGESFYEPQLKPLIAKLKKENLAEDSEGGVIVKLEQANLPPALIQKSDGASLYLTRDIANLEYRLEKYQPVKIIYVVGNEQLLHFQQLFAIAELLSLDQAELIHVKYGLVLGEDKKKLATREGKTIFADGVVDKAVALAKKIILEKNPGLANPGEVAEQIGIGALKYELLKDFRTTDMVFDWKRMLDFSGNSGPYLQYTYARLKSILEKARDVKKAETSKLIEPAELDLIKQLIELPETIISAYQANSPNHLSLYLYQLANLVNHFYESIRILTDEDFSRKQARLVLVKTAALVIKTGLGLLGIQAPEKI